MAKVLIVDDTQDTRELVHYYLTREEFEVIVAADGSEGLYRATMDHPDLIITDITMPVMDGLQLIKEVKNNSELAHLPVIALTAFGQEAVKAALKAGADRALSKPMDLEELVGLVKELLPPP